MIYGYFDEENKSYVITNPNTPLKWINYVGDLTFGGFIDQTGGGVICKDDPALNRIIKYTPQLPPASFNGETCYIRIKKGSTYQTFSLFYVPTLDDYERYECHVGMGYTTFVTQFYGIQSEVTVFVPKNGKRVIRDYKIKNLSNEAITIDLIPVVSYSHFDALKQYTNRDWVPQTMRSERFMEDKDNITLLQYAYMRKNNSVNYFTSNYPISSFETDERVFLGKHQYGSYQNPRALFDDELNNSLSLNGEQIGVLMHHLGQLKPNEEKRIITQLGQTDDMNHLIDSINHYRHPKVIDEAFGELNAYWKDLLNQQQVKTKDQSFNLMLNIFNPRQCHTTLYWSRYLSLYQLGLGARGIGVRDTAQDIMGNVLHHKDYCKFMLKKLLQVQLSDGSSMHQFNPLTMIANTGDSREMEDRDQFYGDDHLWLVLAVTTYLKETGNMDFLEEVVPYYDKDKKMMPIYQGSVFEHLQKALAFSESHVGQHGLPLLGFADWNDTVNLEKGAESMFNTHLYGKALLEMCDLLLYLIKDDLASLYRHTYHEMKNRFNQYAWDGQWYIRYIDHQGTPLGSHKNDYGKIYTNAQSWSVISGFATLERGELSLRSLNQYLNTSKGIKLSVPSYQTYDPKIGGLTTYPPGAKENGGIFLHTNPWVMIAETMLGHGNQAYQYYQQINPINKNDHIDEFECEPYVYPQNILGDEHPKFGMARNSWLSGTASWIYQAASQYILGIRPAYQGLEIDPCIPSDWEKFHVHRHFRQCTYDITVDNPQHVEKGVLSIEVDGKAIDSTILPLFNDRSVHQVKVIMG